MAKVFANNVCEMVIRGTIGSQPIATVLHFFNDESIVNDAAKARDILNNWQDHMLKLQVAEVTLTGADWRSLDRDDQNVGELAPDGTKPTVGAQGFPAVPPNVAALIKKHTANRPRGKRDGRIFLAGIPEGWVDSAGIWDTATRAAAQADVDAFFSGVSDDPVNGGPSGLCVLETTLTSRNPGTHEVDLDWRPLTDLTIDQKVSTQRDRLNR